MIDTARFIAITEELSEVGASAVSQGLALASGGNLSARLSPHAFVITGSGTWLDRLSRQDFSVVNLNGEVIGGSAPPSSEWKLHQRSYRVRADVNAIVHVHPQHAVLMEALGYPVRLLTLDHAYYVRSIGTTPYYPNGSDELADSAAEQALEHNCIIMGNHGCSALGESISMAYRRALNLEEAATATYRALLLGDKTTSMPEGALAALRHA